MITDCSHLFCLDPDPHHLHVGPPQDQGKLHPLWIWALTGTVDRTGGHRWLGPAGSQRRSRGNNPTGTGARTVRGTVDTRVGGHSQHPGHPGPPEAQKLLQTFIWKNRANRTVAEIPGAPVTSLLPGPPGYDLADGFGMLECEAGRPRQRQQREAGQD